MTTDEFKLWFEGFVQEIETNNSSITKQHLEILKEKILELSPPSLNSSSLNLCEFTQTDKETENDPYDIICF